MRFPYCLEQKGLAVFFCLFFTSVLSFPQAAHPHPHSWIDVTVTLLFSDTGDLVALQQTWLFDEFYTAYAVEGFDVDGDGKADDNLMQALLEDTMKNLFDFHYFTEIKQGDTSLDLDRVTDMSIALSGNRLKMQFEVPLAKPLALRKSKIRYAIFDPTYYIEMLHIDRFGQVAFQNPPSLCSYRLQKPNPSPEMVALAFALDQTETAEEEIGHFFAEWVTVTCD